MMKKFNINRKTLYVILCIVLISVFSLTVAYSALNAVLNISGNADVVASSWDIHLDNVKVTSGSVSGTTPLITSPTTATFSTTLNMPGDFYEFTIDVVNDGSIDAMIENITKTPTLSAEQAKYLKYEITYQNGESITTKQLVEKDSYVRLKVRLEYRSDITSSDLPASSETLNLGLKLDYIQSDGSNENVTIENNGKLIKVVSGDGTQTSDEVCIGKECFYVMYSDETTVTMLAKYNLYVGGEINGKWIAYGEEATGMQDSTMQGFAPGKDTNGKGTTPFSSSTKKGTNYSDYSGSLVEEYVNNYRTEIKKLGVAVVDARLITYEELESFGCSWDDISCSVAPSWVYSTTYWSGTAYDSGTVWVVDGDGVFYMADYSTNYSFGVRPVIVISKDLIDGTGSGATKTLIEFTLYGTTYQAEDGMTWEEWVVSEYNTSKWINDGSNIVFGACGYVHYNNILIQSSEIIDSSKQYSVTSCSN